MRKIYHKALVAPHEHIGLYLNGKLVQLAVAAGLAAVRQIKEQLVI